MATIVSAYFRFPSKFPQENYLFWIKKFLEHIPCSLVFYTEADLIPLFTSWRGEYMDRTIFTPFNFNDAEALKKYGRNFWEKELEKDNERDYITNKKKHSAELYAIWYEKKEFVLKTIAVNPFNHEKFLWCDAGGFRITSWFDRLQDFPNADMIHPTKFFLLNINPFSESELSNPFSDFSKLERIGGGYLAASATTWKQYSTKYDIMLNRYREKELFIGKDQNIMASIYVEDPKFFDLVLTNTTSEDKWFYPQLYFSQKTEPLPLITVLIPLYNGIEFLPVSLASICQQTFKDWQILIGINGHKPNLDVFKKAVLIVKSLAKKYEIPLHKINIVDLSLIIKGKPAALNKLVQLVKTPWISILDVDDFWMPNKLESQLPFMETHDVIGGACQYFGDMNGIPQIPIGDFSDTDFIQGNPIINSSVLMKTPLAKWKEDEILEDYELWLRLRYKETNIQFFNVPEILVGHRIHKQSAFNNMNGDYVSVLLARYRN
jgi:hypothetical protein